MADGDDGFFGERRVTILRVAGDGVNPLADERGVDAGADREYGPGDLIPETGWELRLLHVAAVEEHAFGAVEAGGGDLEQNLALAWLPGWHIFDLQNVRAAELGETNGFWHDEAPLAMR